MRPTRGRNLRAMASRSPQHPPPPPLEGDDVRVVLVGTVGWVLALAVLTVLRLLDLGDVQLWWLGMCAYGIALGLFGVHYCRRRDASIARAAAQGLPRRS